MYSLEADRVLWEGRPRTFTLMARVQRAHVNSVTFRFSAKKYKDAVNEIHGLSWYVLQNGHRRSESKTRRMSTVIVHPLHRVGDAWVMTATLPDGCMVVDAGEEIPGDHLVQRGDLISIVVEISRYGVSGLLPEAKRIDVLADPGCCCLRHYAN